MYLYCVIRKREKTRCKNETTKTFNRTSFWLISYFIYVNYIVVIKLKKCNKNLMECYKPEKIPSKMYSKCGIVNC